MFDTSKPTPKFCKKCGAPIYVEESIEECNPETGEVIKVKKEYWCSNLRNKDGFRFSIKTVAYLIVYEKHTSETKIERVIPERWW